MGFEESQGVCAVHPLERPNQSVPDSDEDGQKCCSTDSESAESRKQDGVEDVEVDFDHDRPQDYGELGSMRGEGEVVVPEREMPCEIAPCGNVLSEPRASHGEDEPGEASHGIGGVEVEGSLGRPATSFICVLI